MTCQAVHVSADCSRVRILDCGHVQIAGAWHVRDCCSECHEGHHPDKCIDVKLDLKLGEPVTLQGCCSLERAFPLSRLVVERLRKLATR